MQRRTFIQSCPQQAPRVDVLRGQTLMISEMSWHFVLLHYRTSAGTIAICFWRGSIQPTLRRSYPFYLYKGFVLHTITATADQSSSCKWKSGKDTWQRKSAVNANLTGKMPRVAQKKYTVIKESLILALFIPHTFTRLTIFSLNGTVCV